MAAQSRPFCIEDACTLATDSLQRGIIQRTHGDVDSHDPDPQREFPEPIQCHESIAWDAFEAFLKSGIPPKDSVLITWQTQIRTELIPESNLILLDRFFVVGETVKRDARDHMSGMITSSYTLCDLIPASFLAGDASAPLEVITIKHVPAQELKNVHEFHEGALVVYKDWLGLIEEYYDEITIRLKNNSVVVVDSPEELQSHGHGERLSVGDPVTTKKGNLRRGRWLFGAFDANIEPHGVVVENRTTSIMVSWLCRRVDAPPSDNPAIDMPGAFPSMEEPDTHLGRDELDEVIVYGCPITSGSAPSSYQFDDLKLGDRVRFKDIAGAAVKYDGTRLTQDGRRQGKVEYVDRAAMRSQGFDMNVFLVSETHSSVNVLWQDFTSTTECCTELVPDSHFDLQNEVWPGEVICTTENKTQSAAEAGEDWGWRPAKVGVVQSVKTADRIASVRWFPEANVHFVDDDVMPGCRLGPLGAEVEEVSLYDIKNTRGLGRSRGDVVVIHPNKIPSVFLNGTTGISWLGEVVDIMLDGKLSVRLGLCKPPRDMILGVEDVTLAYSHDMGLHPDNLDSFSSGSSRESDEYFSDEDMDGMNTFSEGEYVDMWIENEDGTRADPDDAADGWTTEDEIESVDENGDTSMKSAQAPINQMLSEVASEAVGPEMPDSSRMTGQISPDEAPAPFEILEGPPPSDHHFLSSTPASSSPARMRRIQKEHKILRSSLPEGIFVRTWEERLDLIRVLIVGPVDTPYEYAPFVVDFYLSSAYPQGSPEAFFHSWTNGSGAINPNLYEDGKICLSLLGTWHGDEQHQNWSPAKSTFLQVLVSLLGLVLVKEPYYNEAGYEVRAGTAETSLASARYSERAYFKTRGFITHALATSVIGFNDVVQWLYVASAERSPRLLDLAISACKKTIAESEAAGPGREVDGLRRISAGAVIQLRRQLGAMETSRS